MSEEYKPGIMGAWPQSILVVEDERTMRMIIKRIIMRLGIPCVREASDGGRAQTPNALVSTRALKTDRFLDPRFGAAHAETSSDPSAVFAKLPEAC